MADTSQVDSAKSKELREKLFCWDAKQNPKAPLNDLQKDSFIDLTVLSNNRRIPPELPLEDYPVIGNHEKVENQNKFLSDFELINSPQQFFSWYSQCEKQMVFDEDSHQSDYLESLKTHRSECNSAIEEAEMCFEHLTVLKTDYVRVATKTNALHEACENLIDEQTRLVKAAECISSRISYFSEYERISSKINAPTFTVNSDSFIPILMHIDGCIEYLNKHPEYKESSTFLLKFHNCLSRVLSLIRVQVFNILTAATQQITSSSNVPQEAPEDAFILFYGKFRTFAPRIKIHTERIEQRLDKSQEYQQLLTECLQFFFQQRLSLLGPSVSAAINELSTKHSRDQCALVRSGCAFLIHICEDEYNLYYHFFSKSTPLLDDMLENLCINLYDVLRPLIIHINHLETLAELCSILKMEMLEDHIQNNNEQLGAFNKVCWQMLQDVQERLVYRSHIFIRQEILNYNPAPGDLAYPEKLYMMESIAAKIRNETNEKTISDSTTTTILNGDIMTMGRQDSTSSVQSMNSLEVERINVQLEQQMEDRLKFNTIGTGDGSAHLNDVNLFHAIKDSSRSSSISITNSLLEHPFQNRRQSNGGLSGFTNVPLDGSNNMPMSPADMHGMWYPTVRRTLVCLSKLHRCVDATFQGLSQDTLTMCIQSLLKASSAIIKNKTQLDGLLFLTKHLLILREQIVPFNIDSAIRETSLDFSKLKHAAVGFLKSRSSLFSLNSNNAFLQFFLEGTPSVHETFLDSRKEVDKQLKKSCEEFIRHVTNLFIGQLNIFLDKCLLITKMQANQSISLRQQPFATAEKLNELVRSTYRDMKTKRPDVQKSMTLYLANQDTEYILFKPIKSNVIQAFQQLNNLLLEHYTEEDRQIIAAPSTDEVNILLTTSNNIISQPA